MCSGKAMAEGPVFACGSQNATHRLSVKGDEKMRAVSVYPMISGVNWLHEIGHRRTEEKKGCPKAACFYLTWMNIKIAQAMAFFGQE
jgi:hypothetical protein